MLHGQVLPFLRFEVIVLVCVLRKEHGAFECLDFIHHPGHDGLGFFCPERPVNEIVLHIDNK